MRNKVLVIALLFFMGVSSASFAQNNANFWFDMFGAEYHSMDPAPINEMLDTIGLPRFEYRKIMLSLGLTAEWKNFMLRVGVGTGGGDAKETDYYLDRGIDRFGLNAGYNLLGDNPKWMVSPSIGISFNSISYNYTQKLSNPSLTGYLDTAFTHRGKYFRYSRTHLDLGFSAAYGLRPLLVRAFASYFIPIDKGQYEGPRMQKLTGGPELSFHFAAGFTLGYYLYPQGEKNEEE